MTKIINITAEDFLRTPVESTRTAKKILSNAGTEPVEITKIDSDTLQFEVTGPSEERVFPVPPEGTLYYGVDGSVVNSDGEYYTTSQGNGILGYANLDGTITVTEGVEGYLVAGSGDYIVDEDGNKLIGVLL